MANTLTGLIPIIYDALNRTSREMVGFIPAVGRDSNADRVGLNQTVRVQVAGTASLQDNTPGATAPQQGNTTDTYVDMTVSNSKHYPILFSGEETLALGSNYSDNQRQRFEQGFRTLTNAVEADIAGLFLNASAAYGEAGTAPFGTKDDLSDFAGVMQILEDNGAPKSDLQLAAGSAAWFNLRGKQTGLLQKVNEAGTEQALRNGIFGDIHGMILRNSSQVQSQSTGSVTGVTANANAVGTTALDVATEASTGAISLNAGDGIQIAGDDRIYIVTEDVTEADGESSVTININSPGLRIATSGDPEITVVADYVANMAFHRNAVQLLTRMPALPEGGDSADDRMEITDPFSGLTFEVAMYRQYRQLKIEIGLAWGQKIIKPEHTAILLG